MTRDGEALLAAARTIRAAGPGPETAALRTAYLELLKLCLCDLAGTTTQSVGAMPDGTVMARELEGDARRLRAAGMDWPLHGLTMVGLRRLDDLQSCVEQIVADGVEGDVIEAGSWRGGAAMLIRATLDSLGDGRTVYVADSFQGFPAGAEDNLAGFDFLAVPTEEVLASFERLGLDERVELVPGFFEETLGGLRGRRWALVRLDADTYEPTRLALEALYPGLQPGGFVVLDDYGSFAGCRRAVDEYRAGHGIEEPLEEIDFTGARWRRTTPAVPAAAPARPLAVPPAVRRPARRPHVPTAEEVALLRERDALTARIEALEAQVGLRPWLRRRLRRRR